MCWNFFSLWKSVVFRHILYPWGTLIHLMSIITISSTKRYTSRKRYIWLLCWSEFVICYFWDLNSEFDRSISIIPTFFFALTYIGLCKSVPDGMVAAGIDEDSQLHRSSSGMMDRLLESKIVNTNNKYYATYRKCEKLMVWHGHQHCPLILFI